MSSLTDTGAANNPSSVKLGKYSGTNKTNRQSRESIFLSCIKIQRVNLPTVNGEQPDDPMSPNICRVVFHLQLNMRPPTFCKEICFFES